MVRASIAAGILYLVASAMAGIDLLSAAAGLCLIAIGILGKVKPRQGILLLNAGLWAIIAVPGVLRAFQAQRWWLLLLACLIVGYAGLNIRFHRLITSLKEETPIATPQSSKLT